MSQVPSGCKHPLVWGGRQTTARGGCNVSHWHGKISMENSKCAISKLHSKWPTWQVRGNEQKKPRGDSAKKESAGALPRSSN